MTAGLIRLDVKREEAYRKVILRIDIQRRPDLAMTRVTL